MRQKRNKIFFSKTNLYDSQWKVCIDGATEEQKYYAFMLGTLREYQVMSPDSLFTKYLSITYWAETENYKFCFGRSIILVLNLKT